MMRQMGHLTAYRMKLKVLTPVFVGGGIESQLNRTGYIYDEVKKKIYIIDETRLAEFLSSRPGLLEEFLVYVEKNSGNAESQRKNNKKGANKKQQNPNKNYIHLSDWLASKRVTNYAVMARQEIEAVETDKKEINDLHLFVRSAMGEPYIPGSAIKGALRSMLVKQVLADTDTAKWWQEASGKINFKEIRNTANRLEQDITRRVPLDKIDKASALRDVFRGLAVSDTSPVPADRLFVGRQLRLSTHNKNGHLKKLPLYLEYLRPGTELYFTVTINHEFFKHSPWRDMDGIIAVLEKAGDGLGELLGERHFRHFGVDYHWSAYSGLQPNFWLGSQTSW